jgi:hypothetical protein
MKKLKRIYRSLQVLSFVLHIILLAWIIMVLQNGGVMSAEKMVLHFTGIGIFGAGLIWFTASFSKWYYQKALKLKYAKN